MKALGFSQKAQEQLSKYKYLQSKIITLLSDLDNKKISIALFENFPFGKELRSELDKIFSFDKVKNYFKDEISIINYTYYFYNEFYNFLFGVITKFDELNIGTKKDEKEKEKYLNEGTGLDFEARLKATIIYSKYVTKRFFELYPNLKIQFKKKPFTATNTSSKKIVAQGSDNRLIEWYSREKLQRLMLLIDLKKNQYELHKQKSRNKTPEPKLKLYKEIICNYEAQNINYDITRLKSKKPKYLKICSEIMERDKLINDLFDEFRRWKKRNPDEYSQLVLKIRNILALQGHIDLGAI